MNIIYAVLDWGLGHATRSLPVLRALIQRGHTITLCSSGEALHLLRAELPHLPYHLLPAYPMPYTKKGFSVFRTLLHIPQSLKTIKTEQQFVQKIVATTSYDRIISDSRYGIYAPHIPSFLITHQLRLITPGRIAAGEYLTERINHTYYKNFKKVLVPDAEHKGLSGDLSHNLKYPPSNICYTGHLTDVIRTDTENPLDCFISLSGPEPQRSAFAQTILAQAKNLSGNTVISLANPHGGAVITEGNVHIHQFLTRSQQIEYMNRANIIVSRSGYTTMMELAELGKKALLIPTPGQTEQEYLAARHHHRGTYHTASQNNLNLVKDIAHAARTTGYTPPHTTKKNIQHAVTIIEAG